jgi:hypothetical protein
MAVSGSIELHRHRLRISGGSGAGPDGRKFARPEVGQMRDRMLRPSSSPRLFDEACSRQKVDHGGDADRHQPSDRYSPIVPTGHCFLPNASQCRSLRGSRGSDPRLLRLTMDGLLDRRMWGATPRINDRPRPKVRPTRSQRADKTRSFCRRN